MAAHIDLKGFLRQHGFRHLRDRDRGATWGNGNLELFVEKSYHKEPGKLRSLMEQIRQGAREKAREKKAEDQKMQQAEIRAAGQPSVRPPAPQPQTPEEHRVAQIEAARAASQQEIKAEILTPPPMEEEREKVKDGRKVKKFAGEERLYVYGRIKAMFQANMDNAAIAKALQAEGIVMPSGKLMDATAIGQCRWNWDKNPDRAARYASILMPRRSAPGSPKIEPVRPVVIAESPKVPRSRFNLPLSVDLAIADSAVGDEERLQILLIFVDLPNTATAVMADESLSVGQKIGVVNALGIRRLMDATHEDKKEAKTGHA